MIIDIGGPTGEAALADPFWAIRGKAIEAHAQLEHAQCLLLGALAGVDLQTASIIFFNVFKAGTVQTIVESLLAKKRLDMYEKFTKSLLSKLSTLSQQRNKIVHWTAVVIVSPHADFERVELRKGADIYSDEFGVDSKVKLTVADLLEFISQCNLLTGLCNCFSLFLQAPDVALPQETRAAWLHTFQQPIEWSIGADHPLFQSRQGLEIQLRPFAWLPRFDKGGQAGD